MADILGGKNSELFFPFWLHHIFSLFFNEHGFLVVHRWIKITWSMALSPHLFLKNVLSHRGNGKTQRVGGKTQAVVVGRPLWVNMRSPDSQTRGGGGLQSGQKHKALQTQSAGSSLIFDCCALSNQAFMIHALSCSGFIGITLQDCQGFNVLKKQIYRYAKQ